MRYLSQKWSDCPEAKCKHIDWTLGLKCDHQVWPWPWLWPCIFKVKYRICYISAKNGLIATERKANISIELYGSNVTIGFDLGHDLDLEFSRSNIEFAISQPKMVRLPWNKKQTYRMNSRIQIRPLVLTLAMTSGIAWLCAFSLLAHSNSKRHIKLSSFLFLAATKQLYKWYFPSVCPSVRLSVCPSVTPFWLCSHHRIIMKFSGVITNDKSKVHAKGQGQRSKVKVTEVTTQLNRFRTVTPVWIHIWWWNDAYSFMLVRRGALLFFKVIR